MAGRAWAPVATLLLLCTAATILVERHSLQARPSHILALEGRPLRTFRCFTAEQAASVLAAGFVDLAAVDAGGRHELVGNLTRVVNRAVLRIRGALLSHGYTPGEVPLEGWACRHLAEDPPAAAPGWWSHADAHPNVLKLAVAGGVCSGKTSGMRVVREALEERSGGTLIVLVVPEIATLLYGQGAMSDGTFANYVSGEYLEYVVESEVLQIALEELWARAADAMLKASPTAERAVMLTDRDAVDAKVYSRPLAPRSTATWPEILRDLGRRLGRPGLSEADLAARYQLGAVVLQSLAIMRGRLNAEQYEKDCLGPNASARTESATQAYSNDVRVRRAYEEVYPKSMLCEITNEVDNITWKLDEEVECVWRHLSSLS